MKVKTIPVRVWDLPTRVFHWVLAASVLTSLGTAWVGGNAMVWHMRLGYLSFALLLFRTLWGLFGGHWSRFSTFVSSPGTSWRYLRGQSRADEHHHIGHNPLGAWSVLALLGILAAQVGTGLFADDEISTQGPLVRFVSAATSSRLTGWHKGYGKWILISLVVLHVAAVLFYLVRRKDNLIAPMLSGDKLLAAGVPAAVDSLGTRMLALALFGAAAGLVGWLVELGA